MGEVEVTSLGEGDVMGKGEENNIIMNDIIRRRE